MDLFRSSRNEGKRVASAVSPPAPRRVLVSVTPCLRLLIPDRRGVWRFRAIARMRGARQATPYAAGAALAATEIVAWLEGNGGGLVVSSFWGVFYA